MPSVFKETIAHKPPNSTGLHCSLPRNQPATFFKMFFVFNHKLPCSFNIRNWNVMNMTLPGTDNYTEKKICFKARCLELNKKNDIYVLKYTIMFLSTYIYGISHVYFKSQTYFSYTKPNLVSLHLYLKSQRLFGWSNWVSLQDLSSDRK